MSPSTLQTPSSPTTPAAPPLCGQGWAVLLRGLDPALPSPTPLTHLSPTPLQNLPNPRLYSLFPLPVDTCSWSLPILKSGLPPQAPNALFLFYPHPSCSTSCLPQASILQPPVQSSAPADWLLPTRLPVTLCGRWEASGVSRALSCVPQPPERHEPVWEGGLRPGDGAAGLRAFLALEHMCVRMCACICVYLCAAAGYTHAHVHACACVWLGGCGQLHGYYLVLPETCCDQAGTKPN